MTNNNQNSSTQDFLSSPALSLSLAGIFRPGLAAVEVGEGSGGRRGEHHPTVEISSDNSAAVRFRSEEEDDNDNYDDHDHGGDKNKTKKRKMYHRHTPQQITEMESFFKESPHPDESQRHHLSRKLGLTNRQVKFWFQNRRTQVKTIQERHENSFLKAEIEKLKDEIKILKESMGKSCCLNCGFTLSKDASDLENNLYIENTRLKTEVEKLRAAVAGKYPIRNEPESGNNSLNFHGGTYSRLDKSRLFEIATQAMEELVKMATIGQPLWVRSMETGREILNYDEYSKEFLSVNSSITRIRPKNFIEASRDSRSIFADLPRLLQSFMDVKQWKEMFPSIISKATTIDIISNGEGPHKNGAIQFMFAELQMLTPVVQTRGVYFVRYCKQLSAEKWAVVDVSMDQDDDKTEETHFIKCRKRASGWVVEDNGNCHNCKVTWVEHVECPKRSIVIPTMFRTIVNSGMAFGARRWNSTLQQHCERVAFFMATNVPTIMVNAYLGITLAGRKCIFKMAQRMMSGFCKSIGPSIDHTWTKVSSKNGDDIRVCSRKNSNDLGEPLGVIVCAVLSVWLPVSPRVVFDFLRDEANRHKWDVRSNGAPAQLIANLVKGQDRGNAVAIQTMKAKDNNTIWILQDSCTNNSESMVVYAPIDGSVMQNAMGGCDSRNSAILASGFTILPDGIESRQVMSSRSRVEEEDESGGYEGGSVLTIVIQVVINNSPAAKLNVESMEFVNSIITSCLQNIKTALHCEDA